DLVGDDFVLDYKTDAEMDPGHHRFQLWAYAEALNKPKAYLAYLRHNVLHEFGPEALAAIRTDAAQLLEGVKNANYEAKPSTANCTHCVFTSICDASMVQIANADQ
ncbi:MAG TPA: PD-(D/E)XK nuclease family protein, partial [Pyrinomonadaceae bacterium]|nr:PD-(D/E)XK nuclease family protein [Pyrinomonadaceae bacterium]